MKIRIGNDFDVSWSITRAGQPESFEPDMPCTVLVINSTCSWIKFEPKFHIVENVVKFRVPADKQQPGKYRLLLQYKKEDLISEQPYRTYTTDICNAFEIVLDSCGENLHQGNVSLTSDVKIWSDGKDGLNAYQLATLVESFEGTVEDYLQDIRRPALDAASTADLAVKDLKIIEAAVSGNEETRGVAESRRNAAEQERQTAETIRNQIFSEKINECSSATQEATSQANYAKTQGEEAATVIAQAGVTYAVTFFPVFNNDNAIYLLDGSSYNEFPHGGRYNRFFVLEKNRNRCMAVIPANYSGNFFYTSLKVIENKLNLALLKVWDNSMSISLNNSEWQTLSVDPSKIINYPPNHEYGFSPVIMDVVSIVTDPNTMGMVNSMREFNTLISDEQKDMLWNYGRPDQVVLPDELYNTEAGCTGEYLSSGFRKNRLIDTSRLKRDIVITGGEIELQYNPLYEDIIYRKTAPNEIPQFVGQRWFNFSAKQWFVASGMAGVSDWVTNSGAAAMAYRITTDENNKVTGIENIYNDIPVTLAIRSNVYVVTELPADNPIGYVFDGEVWTDPFINQEKSLS